MLDVIEKLLIVQEKDQRIRALRRELQILPAEREALDLHLKSAEARLETAKTRSREIEVERKKLEVEADAKRDQIARYKQQQLQTRKNEEYSALAHEIAAAEKGIEQIEDRELELMEEAEQLSPEIKAAEAKFGEEKVAVASKHDEVNRRETAIKEHLETLSKERTAAVEGIDPDTVSIYERLLRSKGDSAIVALEGEICTGCHMKVTTSTAIQARGGQHVVNCPQCGRMLYVLR